MKTIDLINFINEQDDVKYSIIFNGIFHKYEWSISIEFKELDRKIIEYGLSNDKTEIHTTLEKVKDILEINRKFFPQTKETYYKELEDEHNKVVDDNIELTRKIDELEDIVKNLKDDLEDYKKYCFIDLSDWFVSLEFKHKILIVGLIIIAATSIFYMIIDLYNKMS